jgi:hypothetical protein
VHAHQFGDVPGRDAIGHQQGRLPTQDNALFCLGWSKLRFDGSPLLIG